MHRFFIMSAAILCCAQAAQMQFNFPAPTDTLSTQMTRITWYHAYSAPTPAGANGIPLLDVQGRVLSQALSARDWCFSALEGTIRTKSPSGSPVTLNYVRLGKTSQVDCAKVLNISANWAKSLGYSRFAAARGPFGDGVQGNILVPFRTVAADPSIPVGTLLYIPELRGKKIPLPDGQQGVHDGYVMVADRGGAIRGAHIDLFVGDLKADDVPAWLKRWSSQKIGTKMVKNSEIYKIMLALHKP